METASSWSSADKVSFKKIGDQYIRGPQGNIPSNSGQIAKAFLEDKENNEGFNFIYSGKLDQKQDRVRRGKKHVNYCTSFPCDPPAKKVKLNLQEEVASGKIDIGENIVQREYKRNVFDKNLGKLIEKTCFVNGRKHPLRKIQIKLFEKYKKFMRLNSDAYFENMSREEVVTKLREIHESFDENESLDSLKNKLKTYERTRYLIIWHDGSTIINHGHIIFLVNLMMILLFSILPQNILV